MNTPALQQRIAELEAELATAQQQISQLQRDQTLFQGVVEHMPAVLVVKDLEGRFMMLNRTASMASNLTPEQAVGMNDHDLMPPEIANAIQARDREVASSGDPEFYEDTVMIDGKLDFFSTVRFPIRDSQGQVYATGTVAVNVTERKRLEQDNVLFRSIVKHSPIAIGNAPMDPPELNYVNLAYCQLLGYREEELLGLPITEVFGEDPAFINATFQECVTKGTWTGEMRYRHKDGRLIPTLLVASVISDDQGQPIGVTGFVQDLTELKQQAGQLRLFQLLVENAPDGIVIADGQGQITYANRAYHEMFGARESLVGHSALELLTPEERERMTNIWATHMLNKDTFVEQINYRRVDGSTFPAQCSGLVIRDEHEQIVGYATINRDLSEQLRAAEERQELQEQIIMAQQAALRELSTPLMPIAEGVVVMPIIGSIDTSRAQQVMETLLEGIAEHDAALAILDITGVKVVDTQVAGALIRAAQAARLLGADVVLSGISPEIAQTLVHIGVELREIVAKGSLENAIAYALERHRLDHG
ncbi:PAS domain S-box protein [Candidatus Viridilinea mediisalina]|uniref:PAS domain S-box protein n=1 Tax=Candidatus Viridilinea mediisalina TaxID=2024553 RepID=UPI0013FDBD04|nr:PAS domain S-box protein [Candidatus Viridilinea mediisalina]